MNTIRVFKYLVIILFFVQGFVISSCSRKNFVSLEQTHRLDSYVYSKNESVAEMFSKENMSGFGVQPVLTQKELDILDALVDRMDPEVFWEFDKKYSAWLYCWVPLDSLPVQVETQRQLLKCSGLEFQELIEFCKQQDEDVFLLFCQLAARAYCPYDQFLLHPVYDLLDYFPEFSDYWQEVDLSLQKEKPDLKNRTCNEATIWYIRKILETKNRYT